MKTTCLDCGTFIRKGSRCADCIQDRAYSPDERALMRMVVRVWVQRMGHTCPGYQRDSHHATPGVNPLTADHRTPRSLGGATTWDNLQVLCRECNSRKGDRL